jgi:ankyrin repeat protein
LCVDVNGKLEWVDACGLLPILGLESIYEIAFDSSRKFCRYLLPSNLHAKNCDYYCARSDDCVLLLEWDEFFSIVFSSPGDGEPLRLFRRSLVSRLVGGGAKRRIDRFVSGKSAKRGSELNLVSSLHSIASSSSLQSIGDGASTLGVESSSLTSASLGISSSAGSVSTLDAVGSPPDGKKHGGSNAARRLLKSMRSTSQQFDLSSPRALRRRSAVVAQQVASVEALHRAAQLGYVDELSALATSLGADATSDEANRKTALMIAAEEGQLDALSALLRAGADVNASDASGWTALHYAANVPSLRACRRLLAAGADGCKLASSGNTALHYLASKGHIGRDEPYLYLALFMQMLRRFPGIVNVQNRRGETAAHRACMYGGKQSVMFFVKFGEADLSLKTSKGEDLLAYAVRARGNVLPMVHFLLDMPTTAFDFAGAIALARETRREHVAETIEAHVRALESGQRQFSSGGFVQRDRKRQRKRPTSNADIQAKLPDRLQRVALSHACELELPNSRDAMAGKLFATRTHVGFFESSSSTVHLFAFADVVSIDRWLSALVVADSIRIVTGQTDQLVFVGLVDRDDVYGALARLWQRARSMTASALVAAALTTSTSSSADANASVVVVSSSSSRDSSALEAPIKAALAKAAGDVSVDALGFSIGDDEETRRQYARYCAELTPGREQCIDALWAQSGFLDDDNDDVLRHAVATRDERLLALVEVGVPASQRALVWSVGTGAHQKRQDAAPGYWAQISEAALEQGEAAHQIEIDLTRTFGSHALFSSIDSAGSAGLRHVLVSYSLRNAALGYTQSMNYIGGMLMLALDGDLELAFYTLSGVVEDVLHEYYTGGMNGIMVDQGIVDALLAKQLPALQRWWASVGIEWFELRMSTVFPWFMCIFSQDTLPTDTLLWVWDQLFVRGSSVLFEIAIAAFKLCERELLEQATPEGAKAVVTRCLRRLYDIDCLSVAVRDVRAALRNIDFAPLRLHHWRQRSGCACLAFDLGFRLHVIDPDALINVLAKYVSNKATIDADTFHQIFAFLPSLDAGASSSSSAAAAAGGDLSASMSPPLSADLSSSSVPSASRIDAPAVSSLFDAIDVDSDGLITVRQFVCALLLFVIDESVSLGAKLAFAFDVLGELDRSQEASRVSVADANALVCTFYAIAFQNQDYVASVDSLGSHRRATGSHEALQFDAFVEQFRSQHIKLCSQLCSPERQQTFVFVD